MAQYKGAEMYGRRNGRARHNPQTRVARRVRCISTHRLCKWDVLGIYLLMKLRLHSETGLWIYRYDSHNSCIVCRVLALWSGRNYCGDWFATSPPGFIDAWASQEMVIFAVSMRCVYLLLISSTKMFTIVPYFEEYHGCKCTVQGD